MPLTKVSSGVIAANAVVDSFGTQSITGDKLGLTAINANNIVGGAVTGDKIGVTSINANNIVNATITGAKLAANTVSGDVIGQNAISSNNIVSVNASVISSGTLAAAYGGTGNAGGAWTAYTPTVTASSGTFGSTSVTGYYQTIGKTCFVSISISITSVGSASGTVYATLPVTTASRVQIGGYGMEVVNVGSMLKGYCVGSSTQLQITYYNNTSPISLNNQLIMTVVYETA